MAIEKAKFNREDFIEECRIQTEQEIADWQFFYNNTIGKDMLDEDGYPTDDALFLVERWHWNDPKGWFDFIKSIWWAADWGCTEGLGEHDWDKDKETYRYSISTGGWSGNESIIKSMQKNNMMWTLNWVQSRRGGHYIFEIRD